MFKNLKLDFKVIRNLLFFIYWLNNDKLYSRQYWLGNQYVEYISSSIWLKCFVEEWKLIVDLIVKSEILCQKEDQ